MENSRASLINKSRGPYGNAVMTDYIGYGVDKGGHVAVVVNEGEDYLSSMEGTYSFRRIGFSEGTY